MKLSDNLKSIRKENGLSQEQLAEKLGVSRQAVSKWESGQSYPEMDKILLICKLFNYNIDELMNENIKEVNETKQSKNNINKYVDDFFGYITKTVGMFSSMKAGQILKCLIEQILVGLLLMCVFSIIGAIGSSIVYSIFGALPRAAYSFIRGILNAVYVILASIVGITMFLHIFKIRYLDYYEIAESNENIDKKENNENSNEAEAKEKIIIEKKKEKIVIRDPDHSQSKFLDGIIKIVLWAIKFVAIWFAIPASFSFIALIATLIISLIFVKTGLVFVGAFIGIVACLIVNFIVLQLLYSFIVSKKVHKAKLAILFIISLSLAGAACGLVVLGVSQFNIISEDRINNVEEVYTIQMSDNLSLDYWYSNWYNVKYEEEESNEVKVVVKHSEYYTVRLDNEDETISIHNYFDESQTMNIIKDVIEDINNKQIRNYYEPTITIYTSKENIEKIKQNETRKYEETRAREIEDLEEKIYELRDEIEEKDYEIDYLNEEIRNMQEGYEY